jgi:glycine cleavage system H lipoate-binding protein/ABC-type phosphate transport system substrate-binding protein
MKKAVCFLISLFLLSFTSQISKVAANEPNSSPGDSVTILSTPDLLSLSAKWADEYNKLFPAAKIRVISISDEGTADNMIREGSIGFVSNEYYTGFSKESVWKVVVGRDVLVPVINSVNPYLEEISKQGVSPEAFLNFLNSPDLRNWGTLLKNNVKASANYYRINDKTLAMDLAGFLKTDKTEFSGKEFKTGEDMISAIQKDPLALGFCKMVNVLNYKDQNIASGIKLLPIDRNGNGTLEYNEKIYDDYNVLSRGIWIGKYPKALISNIYSVSSNQPKNETEVAFIKWVLTDGQQFLFGNGFTELLLSERQSTIDKVNNAQIIAVTSDNGSPLGTILITIVLLILAGLSVDAIVRYRRRKKATVKIAVPVSQKALDENSLLIPKGLYYDKTHTWAFMDQSGIVKVGIDDFLQHITGPISRIKMKEIGKKVKKGDQLLSIIQNGKQLNLYAPVSGTITEQNKILDKNSSLINSSPYADGWIYKIEPTNWARENQLLFMAEKQTQFIKNEFSRLRDFLAAALSADTEKYAMAILQDGGELRDGILSNLGPEVWEDFQTKFIDPSRQVWFYEII